MSTSPANRANDIFRRMEENINQTETIKTCFGILAIMSRDDVNKVMIAVDGMECILNVMMVNIDKHDIQEAGCDLIWSLAFNNGKVKDIIGKYGGTTVLVRGLKRHSKAADFLKSACGALSNLCQSKINQQGFSSHGGIQPLVGAINFHQSNTKLLPFIFDALASLIVGNEENAKMMSSQEGIVLILATISRLKNCPEVVKSGCHALAILSDVKGQANKIALAGGVIIILSLLDIHPSFSDFHRVAAVVLLRMLQETPIVSREITSNEGVRILLKSLDKGGALEDTVAAVTHILSSITSPLNTNVAAVESQLWISDVESLSESVSVDVKGQKAKRSNSFVPASGNVTSPSLEWHVPSKSFQSLTGGGLSMTSAATNQVSALGGVVRALGAYTERRDVVRAGCRLISHLLGFSGVVMALDSMSILDRIFDCVIVHHETRDVLESAASLLKAIHRRTTPTFHATKLSAVKGILLVFRHRINDDDVVTACLDLLIRYQAHVKPLQHSAGGSSDFSHANSKAIRLAADSITQQLDEWEHESLGLCLKTLETLLGVDNNAIDVTTGLIKCLSVQRKAGASSSRSTKTISTLLILVEKIAISNKGILNAGPWEQHPLLNVALSKALHIVSDTLTPKYSDLIRKIEALQPHLTNRIERPSTAGRSATLSSNAINGSAILIRPIRGFESNAATVIVNCRPTSSSSLPAAQGSTCSNMTTSVGDRRESPTEPIQSIPDSSRGFAVVVNSQQHGFSGGPTSTPFENQSGNRSNTDKSINTVNPYGQLLSCWPSYLERIITAQHTNISKALDDLLKGNSVNRMHMVFEGKSAGGAGLASRCSSSMPYVVPEGGCGTLFEHSIEFDSDFESANLQYAIQRGERTYDLCLRPDVHTNGHTQWFYFAVKNVHPPNILGRHKLGLPVNSFIKITFNIINFTKPDSSFNSGMKPVVYSMIDAAEKGIGWVRQGSDISYIQNDYSRQSGTGAGEGIEYYFTLSFTLEFNNVGDSYLIAYCYPYTYTDNKAHLQLMLQDRTASDIIRHARLCQTLGGKDCDLLIITNFKDKDNIGPLGSSLSPVNNILPSFDGVQEQLRLNSKEYLGKKPKITRGYRRGIFISSRVHPGETPASWVMKGALDFLVGNSPAAILLRQNFVFFIVPMLNPDGVIFGNNRCSLAGVDLNRQWKMPSKNSHPTVYHLKTLIHEQKMLRDVFLYIDIHGHSRKYNVFLYGCDDKKKPCPKAREFPRLFSQHEMGKKFVSLDDCSFHIKKSRESTARVVVCRELNIPYSYTIEATFCGPDMGPLRYYHMNSGHLQDCGAAMCDTILQLSAAEGYLPEGTVIPEPYRGMTQLTQNSFLQPEDSRFKRSATVGSLDDSSAGVMSNGLSGLTLHEKMKSPPKESTEVLGDQANVKTALKSDDDVDTGRARNSDDESDGNPFKSTDVDSSSDDDASGDRPSGSFDEYSVKNGEDDDNIPDEARFAEEGMESNFEGAEAESIPSGTHSESEDNNSRGIMTSPIVEDMVGGIGTDSHEHDERSEIYTSPISARNSSKSRASLRDLIDDEKIVMAGPIATQRIVEGIATLTRQESSNALMDREIFRLENHSAGGNTMQMSQPPIGVRAKRISRKNIQFRRVKRTSQNDDSGDESLLNFMNSREKADSKDRRSKFKSSGKEFSTTGGLPKL